MKDLMLVLEAVRRAQETLAVYHESDDRDAKQKVDELTAILCEPAVVSALGDLLQKSDSPSMQPAPETKEALSISLAGS